MPVGNKFFLEGEVCCVGPKTGGGGSGPPLVAGAEGAQNSTVSASCGYSPPVGPGVVLGGSLGGPRGGGSRGGVLGGRHSGGGSWGETGWS